MDRKRECVEYYVSQGWRVMPLCYPIDGQCSCGRGAKCSAGKAPHFKLAPQGSKNATKDMAVIDEWFNSGLDFNIGICAGAESNLVILDVDP
ncbi:unnamed protein product, partial [marine sediment metagenome]